MDLGISDKAALVTGASGGIGGATARELLAEGARVLLTGHDADRLKHTTEMLGGESDRLRAVVADLSNDRGAKALRDATDWNISILVHAMGVTGAKGDPLRELTDDDWAETWQLDFMSAVRVARAFMPAMVENGWGRMVFVTSENATQPYPDEIDYNVTKAALASFVKGVGQIYAPKGVLVNAVAPAFIATGMTDKMMEKRAQKHDIDFDEAVETFLDEERPHLVLDRRGRPEEVAAVIAFLCSERASFVVGSNYRVDGGSVLAMDA